MNKSLFKSTTHVCNSVHKKLPEKTFNDSKMRTNTSTFRSSGAFGLSKILNSTKGFYNTGINFYKNKYGKHIKEKSQIDCEENKEEKDKKSNENGNENENKNQTKPRIANENDNKIDNNNSNNMDILNKNIIKDDNYEGDNFKDINNKEDTNIRFIIENKNENGYSDNYNMENDNKELKHIDKKSEEDNVLKNSDNEKDNDKILKENINYDNRFFIDNHKEDINIKENYDNDNNNNKNLLKEENILIKENTDKKDELEVNVNPNAINNTNKDNDIYKDIEKEEIDSKNFIKNNNDDEKENENKSNSSKNKEILKIDENKKLEQISNSINEELLINKSIEEKKDNRENKENTKNDISIEKDNNNNTSNIKGEKEKEKEKEKEQNKNNISRESIKNQPIKSEKNIERLITPIVNENENSNIENNSPLLMIKTDDLINNNNCNKKILTPISKENLNELYSFNNLFDDKEKKKIFEKDLEKKLHSYKIKLNKEMLRILKQEKEKEKERNIFYKKANTELDKKRIENLIALERVQSTEKIIKLNE